MQNIHADRAPTRLDAEHGNHHQPKSGFLESFTAHPASVDETYLEHMGFALRFSGRLAGAACAALVHAVVPAWCETTASRIIRQMNDEMESRHMKSERQG